MEIFLGRGKIPILKGACVSFPGVGWDRQRQVTGKSKLSRAFLSQKGETSVRACARAHMRKWALRVLAGWVVAGPVKGHQMVFCTLKTYPQALQCP